MTYEQLEDIMDDLREIHAEHCKDWDASFVCDCPIMIVMKKIYSYNKVDDIPKEAEYTEK